MKGGKIIYRKIVARMALMNLSKAELASRVGISYSTLQNKLCGVSDFTLSEALHIKQLLNFPDAVEDIFVRYETEG